MSHIRAAIDYVKLNAVVEPVQDAMKIVAHVFPRIRAIIESDEIVAIVGESRYVITYSVWDGGLSEWDAVDVRSYDEYD